jgi:hypothetical protein
MCLYSSVCGFIGEIFMTIHVSQFPRICYKGWKFYCNRSIIKGTLLGEQSTFHAVSQLPLEEFLWKFIMRYNRCMYGCDQSLVNGTLLWELSTISAVCRFPLESFFEKSFLALPNLTLQILKVWLESSLMEGTLLEEQCTFLVVSRLPL